MSAATMEKSLEVFQGLKLLGPVEGRDELFWALVKHSVAPWRGVEESRDRGETVMMLSRDAAEGLRAAKLFLRACADGFELTNIVPDGSGQFSPREYNAILQDFRVQVAESAARRTKFIVKTTTSRQSLEDWLTPKAAQALRDFCATANKGTGSAHPRDREQWFRFLKEVHAAQSAMGTEQLARWLTEIGGWSTEMAHELAVEYEFGLALLDATEPERTNQA